jgi:histone-binding protein RBBP4
MRKYWKPLHGRVNGFLPKIRTTHASQTISNLALHSFPELGYSIHKMLIGTQLPRQNYLYIIRIKLSARRTENSFFDLMFAPKHGNAGDEVAEGTLLETDNKTTIDTYIPISGPLHRVEYMPQRYSILATSTTDSPDIAIYDFPKCTSIKPLQHEPAPETTLKGLKSHVTCLDWNKKHLGILAAGSGDGHLGLWDIERVSTMEKAVTSTSLYANSIPVTDVAWHKLDQNLLATASGSMIQLHDLRAFTKPTKYVSTLESPLTALQFNPAQENVAVSGCANGTVYVWDVRVLSKRLWTMKCHDDSITKLAWHPKKSSVLASSSQDRRVLLWDLDQIEKIIKPEAYGDPQIIVFP